MISKADANSPEVAYAYDILFTFAHVFHMGKRKVLSDNEWTGWLRWMKSAFEQGEIMQIWESTIEMEKWFDPAFQQFVDKEFPLARAECYKIRIPNEYFKWNVPESVTICME